MELAPQYAPTGEAPKMEPPPQKSKKLKWTAFAGSFLGRVIHPGHLWKAVRLQRSRKAHRHTYDDAQLALYAQILPSDFLHYGYFDDPDRRPEDISLSDVTRAQTRYAELLLELVGDPAAPVLDVGCGMGGLSRMLKARGFKPTALTPDRLQVSHLKATLPDVPVIRCKFEDLPPEDHRGEYGTIITSESLQYLKLPRALPVLQTILHPGGKWIGCDYFHSGPSDDRSCHVWDDFVKQATDAGWRITFQREITPHVLPTLAFIHMWATRFGVPLMQFAFLRLRRKQPAVHHLAGGVLELLEKLAAQNIKLIDPVQFAASKKYVLFALERG